MTTTHDPIPLDDDPDAIRLAGAFLAGYASAATRRAYRVDLRYWFAFCRRHRLHPYRGSAAPISSCTCANSNS